MSKKVKFFLKLLLLIVCMYLLSWVIWTTGSEGPKWYSLANIVLAFFSVMGSVLFMIEW